MFLCGCCDWRVRNFRCGCHRGIWYEKAHTRVFGNGCKSSGVAAQTERAVESVIECAAEEDWKTTMLL